MAHGPKHDPGLCTCAGEQSLQPPLVIGTWPGHHRSIVEKFHPYRAIGECAGAGNQEVLLVEQFDLLDVAFDPAIEEEQVEVSDLRILRFHVGEPLWVICYRILSGERPPRRTWAGVFLGLGGVAVVIVANGIGGAFPPWTIVVVVIAGLSWGFGSWCQPRLRLPRNPFVVAVYELLIGGALLTILGAASGEGFHPLDYSARAWVAWAYLVGLGSVVAFSAYVWLLQTAAVSLVSTYAYVNPLVAVLLGRLILVEPVRLPTVVGGAVVVAAVAVVVSSDRLPGRPPLQTHNTRIRGRPDRGPALKVDEDYREETMAEQMSPERCREFLMEGTRTAILATTRSDGSPHAVPICFVLDGHDVLFLTNADSVKGVDMRRDPRVTLVVDDETPPFAFAMIEGTAEMSQGVHELRRAAVEINHRYEGGKNTEQFVRFATTALGSLVRIRPKRVLALDRVGEH